MPRGKDFGFRSSFHDLAKRIQTKCIKPHRGAWRTWEAAKSNVDQKRDKEERENRLYNAGIDPTTKQTLLNNVPNQYREKALSQVLPSSQPEFAGSDPDSVFLSESQSGLNLTSYGDVMSQPAHPYFQGNVYPMPAFHQDPTTAFHQDPTTAFHQDPSQLDLQANHNTQSQYAESYLPSCSASNHDLASRYFPPLQQAPYSIPSVQKAPNLEPSFAAQEQFDTPEIPPSPCTSTTLPVLAVATGEEKHDSGRSSDDGHEIDAQDASEHQKNECKLSDDTSADAPLVDEPTESESKELNDESVENNADIVEALSRSLSGNGVRRSASRVDLETFPNFEGVTLQWSGEKPQLRVTNGSVHNGSVQGEVEESRRTETPIRERRGGISSRSSSQVELPILTTTREVPKRYRLGRQSQSRHSSGSFGQSAEFHSSLDEHTRQMLEQNRAQNLMFLKGHQEYGALAHDYQAMMGHRSRKSMGAYSQPEHNLGNLYDMSGQRMGHHCRSMQSLGAHHVSQRSPALDRTPQGRQMSPFPFYPQDECHTQSTQNLCSTGRTPVSLLDTGYDFPSVPRKRDIIFKPKQIVREAADDARSNGSRSRASVSDRVSVRSYHSRRQSSSSEYSHTQQSHRRASSLYDLRNPGAPIDARSTPSIKGDVSMVAESWSDFSGVHRLPSSRPHSVMYPPSYMSGTEHLSIAPPQSQYMHPQYPYSPSPYASLYGQPYAQSTINLLSPRHSASSIRATTPFSYNTPDNIPTKITHRRSMGYLPPSGPLIKDAHTPSPGKRGTTRAPSSIPILQCAPGINMEDSYDKNGERVGQHYVEAKQRMGNVGLVHTIDERKREVLSNSGNVGKVRSLKRERAPARWRSPQYASIAEGVEVPDARGLFGMLERREEAVARGKARFQQPNPGPDTSATNTQKRFAEARTRASKSTPSVEQRLQYHHLDVKQRKQNGKPRMSGALQQTHQKVEEKDKKTAATGRGWMQKGRFWKKEEGEKLVYDC